MVLPIHCLGEETFANADAYDKDALSEVKAFVEPYLNVLKNAPGIVIEPLDSYS